MGAIFGQGTKITHAAWYDQKNKKKGRKSKQCRYCFVCLNFYEKKKKSQNLLKIFF